MIFTSQPPTEPFMEEIETVIHPTNSKLLSIISFIRSYPLHGEIASNLTVLSYSASTIKDHPQNLKSKLKDPCWKQNIVLARYIRYYEKCLQVAYGINLNFSRIPTASVNV